MTPLIGRNATFALMGAAGFVAPRHMSAISEVGGTIIAAFDPNDSVGILDRYFPESQFFTEFERFDRHLYKISREGSKLDYVSICSPNYLHDSHIRFALRCGANAICEKPLVLNPWNADALEIYEKDFDLEVFCILQLRLHPEIVRLKEQIARSKSDKKKQVKLTYVTGRGNWYLQSWKGDEEKSGGIATNIGIHLFDMLHFLFGKVQAIEVHYCSKTAICGCLEFADAVVSWFLSVDFNDVPAKEKKAGLKTFRALEVDDYFMEFSGGFENLHRLSYEKILGNNGFGIAEARSAIETVYKIRHAAMTKPIIAAHSMLKSLINKT